MSLTALRIDVSVSLEDLVEDFVCNLSHETISEFIKKIDLSIAEWDFTLMLCEYFAKQKKEYDKEAEPDDGDIEHPR